MTKLINTTNLTPDQAIEFCQEIVNHRFKIWIYNSWMKKCDRAYDELRRLALDMVDLCIISSINNGDGIGELENKVSWSLDFMESLQSMGRSKTLIEAFKNNQSERTEKQLEIIDGNKDIIWKRKNTRNSYALGTNSEDYFETSIECINEYLKDYLERPWASHPKIDWIFLDMLLTSETCQFFEEIKKWHIPGPKDELGMNKFYYKYEGNLEKMNSDSEVIFRSILSAVVRLIFLPVTITHKLIHWLWTTKSTNDDRNPYLKLRLLMMDTLGTMEGPIVNPSRVKEAMFKASDAGVVWSTGAWALIDHVIQRNPSVWIVDPS